MVCTVDVIQAGVNVFFKFHVISIDCNCSNGEFTLLFLGSSRIKNTKNRVP